MKNRQPQFVFEKFVEKAMVVAVKMAIESVPVIGPVFFALSIVSDVRKVQKAMRRTEPKSASSSSSCSSCTIADVENTGRHRLVLA